MAKNLLVIVSMLFVAVAAAQPLYLNCSQMVPGVA
jgi:hypothetical protein